MMTNYTENILRGNVSESREMREDVRNNDRQRLLGQCKEKSPLIVEVAREVGWRTCTMAEANILALCVRTLIFNCVCAGACC